MMLREVGAVNGGPNAYGCHRAFAKPSQRVSQKNSRAKGPA
jgi:hypothetical protein